jgi:type VI secretion system protein ImpA
MSEAVDPVLEIEQLLAPLSGSNPAGQDVRYSAEFDKLKAARRDAEATEQAPREGGDDADRTSAVLAAWASIADLAADILRSRAKDLQAALWLLEALARLEGFRGAMTGLQVLSGIFETYWDGFYPTVDPEDDEPLGFRAGLMSWVDERLPAVLKTAPLTGPPDGYSLVHYDATLKTGDEKKALVADGWPTTEQFDAALKGSSLDWLETVLREVSACREALETLARVSDTTFVTRRTTPSGAERVETLLSFGRVRETLETAQWLVERVAKAKRPVATKQAAASAEGTDEDGRGSVSGATDGGGDDARAMVRRNQLDGLRVLQNRLAEATSGRDRFLRKLDLAEACLEAGVHALAYPFYDDVARTIQDRGLMDWEDRAILLRVWKGLSECCEPLKDVLPNTEGRRQEAIEQITALGETP